MFVYAWEMFIRILWPSENLSRALSPYRLSVSCRNGSNTKQNVSFSRYHKKSRFDHSHWHILARRECARVRLIRKRQRQKVSLSRERNEFYNRANWSISPILIAFSRLIPLSAGNSEVFFFSLSSCCKVCCIWFSLFADGVCEWLKQWMKPSIGIFGISLSLGHVIWPNEKCL